MYNIHTKEDPHRHLQARRQVRRCCAQAAQSLHARLAGRQRDQHGSRADRPDLDLAQAARLERAGPSHLRPIAPPQTNESLRKKGGGQAKRSQHILGKAADITFPDVPVKVLRNSALVQEHGGVGYYPTSGIPFVHVDTGNVRMWPRIPRLELAALFPDGRDQISADRRQADHAGRLQARPRQGHGQQDHVRCGDAVRQGQVAAAPDTDVVRRGRERCRGRNRYAAAGARFRSPRL